MKLIVFFLAASFCTAAQGPVLTSVSKQELVQQIAANTQQIKGKSETINTARAQLKDSREKLSKSKADLVSKRKELYGIKDDSNKKKSLEKQISDLEKNIDVLNKKILELEDLINQQSAAISELQDAINKLEVKIDELNRQEENKNQKKKEAASLYARVKILIDSLLPAEKATLNATNLGTLNFYRDLLQTDDIFKLNFQKQVSDARKELEAEHAKNFSEDAKASKKAILEMIRKYLAMLSEIQPQI